jgi:DUF4097 and DUF4098 domain-containing protein YvlB
MITAILLAALSVGVAPQATDTVVAVQRGDRLEVDNFRGEVVVRSWDRDAVGVRADLSGRQTMDVVRAGSAVRVRPRSLRGGPEEADFEIQVPRWMSVRVEGNQLDVTVRGTDADVSVETIGGDLLVEGGSGLISLRTIQGEVVVRGASGRIDVVSVNDDVTLRDVRGDIHVQTTNGDVTLNGIRSTAARATTVNGDITYDGTIADGGRYVLSTHNGDVTATVPANVGATVTVSTYHGGFRSDFPVRLTGTTRARQFNFTLGSGGARIELESFNGEILLRRP